MQVATCSSICTKDLQSKQQSSVTGASSSTRKPSAIILLTELMWSRLNFERPATELEVNDEN